MRTLKNLLFLLGLILSISFAFAESKGDPLSQTESIKNPSVGGPCDYKYYEGTARIISINQRGDISGKEYEMKFLFYPSQEIKEPFAQMEGREFLLLTKLGSYPTAAFIEKNGIEIGKVIPCILNVIVQGTCTPTIFEFPSLQN